ncbi:MAG: M20/M25/M40 family metallo-hydrolase [Candidatus Krumholzibacteriota bacterium]|nr:M20/M25/M40 family metallo-hydrolase [Candidatus Krumholzibacteriota bacterium]
MTRSIRSLAAALAAIPLFASCTLVHEPPRENVSIRTETMRGVIEFLSSDLLEGRAPGTRGGRLAEEYMRSVMRTLGIEPWQGSYFHEFTLEGFTLESLDIEAAGVRLALGDDAVGSYVGGGGPFALEGEAVFAGYGIDAADWEWNDYGDASLAGKIAIVRVNEPGRDDPDLFEGPAMTYYGRWTYKIEEAARRGARGILLVHTTETAGYGWPVVRNSWGGEELYLPSMIGGDLLFRGWIREERLREILAEAGRSFDELCLLSETRGFQPVPLGFSVSISGTAAHRSVTARNVAGVIPAGSPAGDGRAILLSAHIDHLGLNPSLEGDGIFNGAIDNGAAVAAMIGTAQALAERRRQLRHPVIVLACGAEEAGLLGSRRFAAGLDSSSVLCNVNFESSPVWGPSRDLFAVGARHSTLDGFMCEVAAEMGLEYGMFSMSEQGFFYRSDQFSFARRGIPAIWISAGEDFEDGVNHIREFFTGEYHTPDDEYDPAWTLESTAQTAEAAARLAVRVDRAGAVVRLRGRRAFPVGE